MQGLLLVAASHMEHTAHIERAKGKTSHHINGCIQVVKSHILNHQAVSSALVFIVTHLCAAEGARGNLIASMVHLRGVRDIVNELGGPDKLDDNIRDILIGLDGYRAVQMMQRPLWPCYYDPGSAEENLSHQSGLMACLEESSCIGEGLTMHEMWGESHSALRELTQQLTMALRVWHYAWSRDLEDRRVWYWLLRRFQAIRHHMLLTDQCDPLQETLRIAIILWNAMVRSAWGAQKIVKAPIPILIKALRNCESYTWHQWSAQHHWILSIGAMAARGTEEAKWFQQELRELWTNQPSSERYQNLRGDIKGMSIFRATTGDLATRAVRYPCVTHAAEPVSTMNSYAMPPFTGNCLTRNPTSSRTTQKNNRICNFLGSFQFDYVDWQPQSPFSISSLLPLKNKSVPVGPGATALTEMSFLARSLDIRRTIWSMAPFVAQYNKYGGATVDAKIDCSRQKDNVGASFHMRRCRLMMDQYTTWQRRQTSASLT